MKHFLTVKSTQKPRLSKLLLGLAITVLTLPSLVAAKDYKVEVLVFENIGDHRAYESYRNSEIDEMLSNATVWQMETGMLEQDATSIVDSEDYQLTHHLSWAQESLPYSESAAINVIEPGLNGWIKVYASHLLFINVDLDFNGYRMTEKRRIKLNEKHFFDHPKFGLLMQVSRLEEPELDATNDADPIAIPPQSPDKIDTFGLINQFTDPLIEGYLSVGVMQTKNTN